MLFQIEDIAKFVSLSFRIFFSLFFLSMIIRRPAPYHAYLEVWPFCLATGRCEW